MDYRQGPYMMAARKDYRCALCGDLLPKEVKLFTRVVNAGPEMTRRDGVKFYPVKMERHHLACALELPDLTDQEKKLLGPHLLAYHFEQENVNSENIPIAKTGVETALSCSDVSGHG